MPARTRPSREIDNAAAYLGASVRHVRRLVGEGCAPYIESARDVCVDPDTCVDEHRNPVGRSS